MDIELRLIRMERQNRIFKGIFGLAGLAAAALIFYGATKPMPDVIQARRFEVVNEAGRAVVLIESWKHGGAILTYPKNGEYRPSVSLLHTDDGHGFLTVYAKDGGKVFATGGTDYGGLLDLYSKGGKKVFRARAAKNGSGGLVEIINKTGEGVIQLEVDDYGNGLIGAYNRTGKGRTLQPGP